METSGGGIGYNELADMVPRPTDVAGLRKLSLTERLTAEKERLQHRLSEVEAVLTALRENPKLQEVIDLVFRVA